MQMKTACSIDINVQQTSAAIIDVSSRSNMIAMYSSSNSHQQEHRSAAGATFSSRSNIHSSRSNIHSNGPLQHPCEAAAAQITGTAEFVLLANEVEYRKQRKGKKRTGKKRTGFETELHVQWHATNRAVVYMQGRTRATC